MSDQPNDRWKIDMHDRSFNGEMFGVRFQGGIGFTRDAAKAETFKAAAFSVSKIFVSDASGAANENAKPTQPPAEEPMPAETAKTAPPPRSTQPGLRIADGIAARDSFEQMEARDRQARYERMRARKLRR